MIKIEKLTGSILFRHIFRQIFSLFLPTLAILVGIYLIVDAMSRMDILIRHNASVSASARYFLFKIPLIITQVTPPALIVSILIAFGILARGNEIIALRASGISLLQTSAPVVLIGLSTSLAILAWNESIVPYSSFQFQSINNDEIRHRERVILGDRQIWIRGKEGFYNLVHIDRQEQTIAGLIVYKIDDEFHLKSVVRADWARWTGTSWEYSRATEYRLSDGQFGWAELAQNSHIISEPIDDFMAIRHEPEELSYIRFRGWVRSLREKGIDVSHYLVDLNMKLSLPFANLTLALLGVAISGRVRQFPSISAIVGFGMIAGFGFWVLLALSASLGQAESIPPFVASWAANLIYILGATVMLLRQE